MTTRETKPLRDEDRRPRAGVFWIKTDFYCMDCGKQNVWQRSDEGCDYYHECTATCHACGREHCCVLRVKE